MRMDRRGFMQTGVALVASATVAKQGLGQTSGQANCFVESGADTVVVNSMAGLENAVNSAPAGRQIPISAGSYTGGTRTFNADGTQANPIVIRPQGARGTVTINNANWRLAAGSARLVFANLYFNNPQVTVNGSHHRFTRCRFRAVSRPIFLLENCTDTRIDHCDLSGWVNSAASKEFFTISNAPVVNGSFRRLLFDYNYIHDISHPTEPALPGSSEPPARARGG